MEMRMYKGMLLILGGLLMLSGCEITQHTSPSPVEISIVSPPAGDVDASTTPPAGAAGTIALEPNSITVAVSKNVNVKVVVKDEGGVEIPSENISVNIVDKTILRLQEIDGRMIAFEGVAAGVTSVIVTASGLQTSLAATVVP